MAAAEAIVKHRGFSEAAPGTCGNGSEIGTLGELGRGESERIKGEVEFAAGDGARRSAANKRGQHSGDRAGRTAMDQHRTYLEAMVNRALTHAPNRRGQDARRSATREIQQLGPSGRTAEAIAEAHQRPSKYV